MARYNRTGSAEDLQKVPTRYTKSLYESSNDELDCLIGRLPATKITLMLKDHVQGAQFLTECRALLPSKNSISSVPRALHRVILELKAKDGNSENIPLWASFIHLGP